MRKAITLLLILSACSAEEPQNAVEIANNASMAPDGMENQAQPEAQQSREKQTSAPAPDKFTVGPLQVHYNAASLTPVETSIPLPPDWKTSVRGMKLIGVDRAALIGRAECIYGQSGQASRCNPDQEAGLAFASLPVSFAEASEGIPTDKRKDVSLAETMGFSWEIGAEGEGAEYIILPAEKGSILIVRQLRATGNPPEAAIGNVLADLKLNQ